MQKKKFQNGFTLIEMIVVLTIVAIMGILAVSTYSGTRRQARLDISVDSFVSALREQAGKAKNGQLIPFVQVGQQAPGGQSDQQLLKSACFGVALNTQGAEPLAVEAFPYVAITPDGRADVCDPLQIQKFPYQAFEELQVKELLVNGGQKYDQLKIFYKPPFARMIIFDQGSMLQDVKNIKVIFDSKNPSQNPLQRCVQIDVQNNLITRLDPSAC